MSLITETKLRRVVTREKVICVCCSKEIAKPYRNPFGKGLVHKNCVKYFGAVQARERLNVFAEENKNAPTPSEKLLLHRLEKWGRENNIEIIFQQVFWGRIFDFHIRGKGVLIEVDGGYHLQGTQRRIDEKKQRQAIARGFVVIRIRNEEVSDFDLSLLLADNPSAANAERALDKWLSLKPRLKNKRKAGMY